MTIERYTPSNIDGDMIKCDNGQYVSWRDCADLLAALKNYETPDGKYTEAERRAITLAAIAKAEGK